MCQKGRIMVTKHQIILIRDSFSAVLPVTDAAAEAFYTRLFELAPDTRPLFRNDMVDQGRKLFLTLSTVIDALDRPDRIASAAGELAVRHVGYGTQEHHYSAVGSALIETLRTGLGSAFDQETEDAWLAAYDMLSRIMLNAARRVR